MTQRVKFFSRSVVCFSFLLLVSGTVLSERGEKTRVRSPISAIPWVVVSGDRHEHSKSRAECRETSEAINFTITWLLGLWKNARKLHMSKWTLFTSRTDNWTQMVSSFEYFFWHLRSVKSKIYRKMFPDS